MPKGKCLLSQIKANIIKERKENKEKPQRKEKSHKDKMREEKKKRLNLINVIFLRKDMTPSLQYSTRI